MSVQEHKDFPTPGLIRAARGLLNISQQDLADLVGLSLRTVAAIETDVLDNGVDQSGPGNERSVDARRRIVLSRIRAILESACAIELTFSDGTAGEGVKLKKAMTAEFFESIKRLIEEGRKAREGRRGDKQLKASKPARSSKAVSPTSLRKRGHRSKLR
jgi:DNA-binding XRE family transcriptional regulator